ncbi:30S ribosomal protein S9 [Candidatus Falkowbacteria bacterium]|nr:30S ribosomal protein S9 [Candidatus Falkowbacteria bacterium]
MAEIKKIRKQTRRAEPVKRQEKAKKAVVKVKKEARPAKALDKAEEPKIEPVIESVKEIGEDAKKKSEYLFGLGRRKTSIAQVRIYKKGEGRITINGKELKEYFHALELRERIFSPFKIAGQADKLDLTAKVQGGGICSQAEAVRHGVSRALLQLNPNFRKPLKKAGFLTRDPRRKERKKPGLKRARKAPQWQKR